MVHDRAIPLLGTGVRLCDRPLSIAVDQSFHILCVLVAALAAA